MHTGNEVTLTAQGPAPKSRSEAWVAFEAALLGIEERRERLERDRAGKVLKNHKSNLRRVGALLFAHDHRPNRGGIMTVGFDGTEEWVTPPVVGIRAEQNGWAREQGWATTRVINPQEYPLRAMAQVLAHMVPAGHPVLPNVRKERYADATQPMVTPEEVAMLVDLRVAPHQVGRHVARMRVEIELYGAADPEGVGLADRSLGRKSAWGVETMEELFAHLGVIYSRVAHYPVEAVPVGLRPSWELCRKTYGAL